MEFDKMESLWAKYDQKLEKSLRLNETLLRKINLNKALKEGRKPFLSELGNIILSILFIIYLLLLSILLVDQFRFSIPGFIAAGGAIVGMILSIARASKISDLNAHALPIIELQKRLYDLQSFRTRFAKLELFAGLTATIFMWPIIIFTGFDIDIYQSPMAIIVALLVCAVIAIPFLIWHERFYQRRLANVGILLQEINDLEN